jgi:hypothetical protein
VARLPGVVLSEGRDPEELCRRTTIPEGVEKPRKAAKRMRHGGPGAGTLLDYACFGAPRPMIGSHQRQAMLGML